MACALTALLRAAQERVQQQGAIVPWQANPEPEFISPMLSVIVHRIQSILAPNKPRTHLCDQALLDLSFVLDTNTPHPSTPYGPLAK